MAADRIFSVRSVTPWLARIFIGGPIPLRLARVIVFILIGFVAGRLGLGPGGSVSSDRITQSVYLFRMPPQDRQFVFDYINESEVWLLAVVEPQANPRREDLSSKKETAHRLLFKTCSLEAVISSLNNASLSGFLNQMEHVLLEVSNTQDDDLTDVFMQIQKTIKSTHLHEEPKRLQRMLHSAGFRGA